MSKSKKRTINSPVNENLSKQGTNATSKEIQETLNKTPKLTKEYFKISSLSEEQKQTMKVGETIDWRAKEEVGSYTGVRETKEYWEWSSKRIVHNINQVKWSTIIIKKMIEWNVENAYVIEYISGIPEKYKGIQMLNTAAAYNLWIYKDLPRGSAIIKMVGKRKWWVWDKPDDHNIRLIDEFIEKNNLSDPGLYVPARNAPIMWMDSGRYFLLLKDNKHMEVESLEVVGGKDFKDSAFPVRLIER